MNNKINSFVRLANVNLPGSKAIFIGLSYIYGIGRPKAEKIASLAGIDKYEKLGRLSEEQLDKIREIIQQMVKAEEIRIEDDLRKEVVENIKNLRKIGSYRGSRHAKGLPVRGQRTKTNARTRKGKKKQAIANKKVVKK